MLNGFVTIFVTNSCRTSAGKWAAPALYSCSSNEPTAISTTTDAATATTAATLPFQQPPTTYSKHASGQKNSEISHFLNIDCSTGTSTGTSSDTGTGIYLRYILPVTFICFIDSNI
jgi:hypothetical protein